MQKPKLSTKRRLQQKKTGSKLARPVGIDLPGSSGSNIIIEMPGTAGLERLGLSAPRHPIPSPRLNGGDCWTQQVRPSLLFSGAPLRTKAELRNVMILGAVKLQEFAGGEGQANETVRVNAGFAMYVHWIRTMLLISARQHAAFRRRNR